MLNLDKTPPIQKVSNLKLIVALGKYYDKFSDRNCTTLAYHDGDPVPWWEHEFEVIGSSSPDDLGIPFYFDMPKHACICTWSGRVRLYHEGEYVDEHHYIGEWNITDNATLSMLQSGVIEEYGWKMC